MPGKGKTKGTKRAKETAKVETPKVEEPEPVQETAQPEEPERRPEQELADSFASVLAAVQLQQQQLTALKGQIKVLEKKAVRELKAAIKQGKKGRRKTSNRKPSGFVKPTEISSQLASFLGKPEGTSMARTEVTKEINAYIREHNLQDPANGRHILPNKALKSLLNLGKNDELTYFNLQRYMSPHFAKATSAESSA